MSRAELLQVIKDTAETAGLKIDDDVVEDLVRSAVGDVTALPMLQFTLSKLWQARERNRVTRDVYQKVGRPRDALKRTAEEVFDKLDPDEQKVAEQIFLELVQPMAESDSPKDEFIRRRVRRDVLLLLDKEEPERVDRVLYVYIDAGLIRRTPAADRGDERQDVEIRHAEQVQAERRGDAYRACKNQLPDHPCADFEGNLAPGKNDLGAPRMGEQPRKPGEQRFAFNQQIKGEHDDGDEREDDFGDRSHRRGDGPHSGRGRCRP